VSDIDRNIHRDVAPCPGCDESIPRHTLACKPCWRSVPGDLKAALTAAPSGSTRRKQVVTKIREWFSA
jgi:hypothetical protein